MKLYAELETQFRLAGSKAFVGWVDHTLGLTETAHPTWDAEDEAFDSASSTRSSSSTP